MSLASVREYLRLATVEPEVLRVIGEESQRKGTDKLSSRRIQTLIKVARAQTPKRGGSHGRVPKKSFQSEVRKTTESRMTRTKSLGDSQDILVVRSTRV